MIYSTEWMKYDMEDMSDNYNHLFGHLTSDYFKEKEDEKEDEKEEIMDYQGIKDLENKNVVDQAEENKIIMKTTSNVEDSKISEIDPNQNSGIQSDDPLLEKDMQEQDSNTKIVESSQ